MTESLDSLLAELEKSVPSNDRLPPVEKWDPPLSGDIDIRIAANGQWFHEGEEIRRQGLVKVFSSILKREEDEYFLVTPVEKWRIQVEDAPFLISRMEKLSVDGEQVLVFYTSVGDRLLAGPEHPLRVVSDQSGDPRPYVLVRGGMEGLLDRPVYYQLAELALAGGEHEKKAVYGVYSLGEFFPLQ